MTIAVLTIHFFSRFVLEHFNRLVLMTLLICIIVCTMSYFLFDNLTLMSMFARRVMYLPNQLAECYFDFFSNHEADYFRNSFLRNFGFTSPYGEIPFYIGKVYFNSPSMHANCGLLADAMTNLSYLGIVVFPILIGFMFKVLDWCSEIIESKLYIAIALNIGMTLISSSLFTALLSHGIILIAFCLFCLSNDDRIRKT